MTKLHSSILAFAFCLLSSGIAAETDTALHENQDPAKKRIAMDRSKDFTCAEIIGKSTRGVLDHEIELNNKTVKRCLLKKVGSRLHECKRLDVQEMTVDQNGVVEISTEEGPVKFWFDESAVISEANRQGSLVFHWPDKDSRFNCLPLGRSTFGQISSN